MGSATAAEVAVRKIGAAEILPNRPSKGLTVHDEKESEGQSSVRESIEYALIHQSPRTGKLGFGGRVGRIVGNWNHAYVVKKSKNDDVLQRPGLVLDIVGNTRTVHTYG